MFTRPVIASLARPIVSAIVPVGKLNRFNQCRAITSAQGGHRVKKIEKVGLYTLIGATLLISVGLYGNDNPLPSEYCAFCDRDVVNRQKFYEDALVVALYTHKPILPGHCLVIPKRHVERFEMLTDVEITQMSYVIKRVNQAASEVFNTSPYLLLQKNGVEVGQTVPHVHFHYIPRQKGDDSTLKFLVKMYIRNLQNPLSAVEMQTAVEKMKKALETQESL